MIYARKGEQRSKLSAISRSQCIDVLRSALTVVLQVRATRPINAGSPIGFFKQRISHDARMPAIAIWKGMNDSQPVMKPERCFKRRIGFMLKPKSRIINASPQLNCDMQGINSDIPLGLAQFTTPIPHLAEQPLVKLKCKGIGQNVRPSQAAKRAILARPNFGR